MLEPLKDTGNVAYSYQSTAIETWLDRPGCGQEERQTAKAMTTLPGVIATYVRNGDRYDAASSSTA